MLIQKDSSDQVLRKTELAAVFPTDTELFDRIDKSEDGQITLEEWLGFLRTTHAVMEENEMESGDRWLENIIEALRLACMGKAERDAQEAAREIEIAELMDYVEKTYAILASQNTEDAVLRKRELVKAHGTSHMCSPVRLVPNSHALQVVTSSYFLGFALSKPRRRMR